MLSLISRVLVFRSKNVKSIKFHKKSHKKLTLMHAFIKDKQEINQSTKSS